MIWRNHADISVGCYRISSHGCLSRKFSSCHIWTMRISFDILEWRNVGTIYRQNSGWSLLSMRRVHSVTTSKLILSPGLKCVALLSLWPGTVLQTNASIRNVQCDWLIMCTPSHIQNKACNIIKVQLCHNGDGVISCIRSFPL